MDVKGEQDEYDVVVVGAGFGGPVAARKCAEAGLKTLMLERGEKAGEKVISGLTIPFYGFLFGPQFIRDGNPPVERPVDGIINYIIRDIETGDIDIDDSLKIPKPLSPVLAFGYNAYCQPFCEWEADKAVESGAEFRTSTAVTGVIKENGRVKGVVTDGSERIGSKIVIDAEGSQGLLAISAGVREKYTPDVISLADVYDYEMKKEDVDRIFGHSIRFCWGWDEQGLAPPLGYGNGLMVWPYRGSIHWIQDECVRISDGQTPNLVKDFEGYHRNITSQLPWWREEVAPRVSLRAHIFDTFEIYVGLDERLRNMPNHADGMILIGDAAGLESTALCDGVPAAWFSADIAADVAMEAVKAGDTSASFLKRYDDRIKAHPIIQWSITSRERYDLRRAQASHDERELKRCVHNGWGLGGFNHMSTPLVRIILDSIAEDPSIIASWVLMYCRYYYNWAHERFDGRGGRAEGSPAAQTAGQRAFRKTYEITDRVLERLDAPIKRLASLLAHLSPAANPMMKTLLPLIEPVYCFLIRFLEPLTDPLSRKLVEFVENADPAIFNVAKRK
ncbi:MAG: NAD(P)/FAD-dependent oxidoreductase [Actinobacteria bacterium]|nr:NAD(P)/FAD-dependent oxidoreductase [Actinomycetota bacterium]